MNTSFIYHQIGILEKVMFDVIDLTYINKNKKNNQYTGYKYLNK